MAYFEIGSEDRIYFEETEPSRRRAPTFVFVNALLDTLEVWESAVAPALRAAGCGVVLYDQRGQGRSAHAPKTPLTVEAMTADLLALLDDLHLETCVLVGDVEGALIATQAVLAGAPASGLALLNGLRPLSPRILWAMRTAPHLAARGGAALLVDAWLPMLAGLEYLAATPPRAKEAYAPLDSRSGLANRLRCAAVADWSPPYERIALPVLAIAGLQDRLFLDPGPAAALAARMPQARYEAWPDAGHFLARERPQALIERLSAFGAALRPPPPGPQPALGAAPLPAAANRRGS